MPRGRLERLTRSHAWRPSHDLATVYGTDHGLGEMVEARILRKETVEHGAERECASTFEGFLIDR